MHRLFFVAALLAAVALVPASAVAAPDRPLDWVALVVTAGPHGASHVRYTFEIGTLHGRDNPSTLGMLESVYDPSDQRHPGYSCGLVAQGNGHHSGHVSMTSSEVIAHLDPGERLAELVLAAGGVMYKPRLGAVAGSGSVKVVREVGTGAQAIDFVPKPAAGTETRSVAVRNGLAGAFISPAVVPPFATGVASWTAPDRSSGKFIDNGLTVGSCGSPWTPAFAGGAGAWRWSWTGIGGSQQVGRGVVAWAPIGPAWSAFRVGPVTPTSAAL